MIETNDQLIREAAEGRLLTREELTALLRSDEEDSFLFETADRLRRERKGDDILIRSILEFSNYCRCQCCYCGLNCHNFSLPRYRMMPEEIVDGIQEAWEAGYRTVVLQSGEDPWYTQEILCELIRAIKKRCPIAITLSVGERSTDDYRAFREAGADRYLLKHETSDPALYQALHPGASQQNRLRCQQDIKRLGYEAGGGFMVGLPKQTLESIAGDLLTLRDLPCDMAGIGPFLPHPDTPLRDYPAGSAYLTKKAVALARLLLPDSNLPATTALSVLSGEARSSVFSCGANVIMRKVTPWSYRRNYEIYPVQFGSEQTISEGRQELEAYIRSIGRKPV